MNASTSFTSSAAPIQVACSYTLLLQWRVRGHSGAYTGLVKPPPHSPERWARRWRPLSSHIPYRLIGWVGSEFMSSSSRCPCVVCHLHTGFQRKNGNTIDKISVPDLVYIYLPFDIWIRRILITALCHRSPNRCPGHRSKLVWPPSCLYAWSNETLPHEST